MAALERIALFETLFVISIIVAGIGLLLAVFFFFYFDIPGVYALMTGRGKEATIRRHMENSAKTGPVRKPTGLTGQMGANTGKMSMIINPAPAPETRTEQTSVLVQGDNNVTAALHSAAAPPGFFFQVTEDTMVIHTDELL